MDPDFWHNRWREARIGFHQSQINSHLQAFWPHLGVAPPAQVFVPLCGKSLDLLWLRDQGYSVLGVEISPVAVEALFTENHLAVQRTRDGLFERWTSGAISLMLGDFFDLDATHLAGTAAVYDRASLVALPPAMRPGYARRLAELVPERTPVLLVTLEYPQGEMEGPPFSVPEDEVRGLFGSRYDIDPVFEFDVLAESPKFRDKGLSMMKERVYLLSGRSRGG
ncbi:MAG: thiopurine S-methyltransferase [Pseudomonadota bacterium]